MIESIIPKLPMRQKAITEKFYTDLGFETSQGGFPHYLMMKNGTVEIHFFEFKDLVPEQNYGQIYLRCSGLEELYTLYIERGINIHPAGSLSSKPWGQKEFSILDPDNNLITLGEATGF